MQKEWLEELVVRETMKLIQDDAVIDKIVQLVMDVQNQENTTIPLLEIQKDELTAKIADEKLKKPSFNENFIRFWLMKFRKFDISQKKQRKALIEIFVNAIFLYDDRMLITFNYKDGTQTVRFEDTLTTDSVEEKVRICPALLDQKLHRRICSSVELFCLPTAWSENEKRMQNAVRLKKCQDGIFVKNVEYLAGNCAFSPTKTAQTC